MGNKPWTKEELDIIQGHNGSIEELQELLPNRSYDSIRQRFKKKNQCSSVKSDAENLKTRSVEKENTNKYKEALKIIQEQENKIELITQLKDADYKPIKIVEDKTLKGEATAFIVLSDVHADEIVKSSMVGGLNSYNLEIAEERIKYFFINAIKLLNMSRNNIDINTLVFAILGDLISSNIHEELLSNTSCRPIEAMILVQNWIISGIEYLLKNFKGKIIIPMTTSNHTRITDKINVSNEMGNDLGYYLYNNVANHFKEEKRIVCIIPEAYHVTLDVYGSKIVFHHGHFVKYNGGVGGPTISINKAIAQWNKIFKADLYIQGHLHQYFDGGNFLINGSMIGFNPYAMSIKASFEEPKQLFFLWDKRFGKTIVAPIILKKV